VIAPVFESAIAVRDEATTAFFGRLAEGRPLPADLQNAFYDEDGDLLGLVPAAAVQGPSSGLVYATPTAPLSQTQQNKAIAASHAAVIVGDNAQPTYLGQAEGTISEFKEGYWKPEFGGRPGCPHCLAYFLCVCLPQLEGVTLDYPPPEICRRFDDVEGPCTPVVKLRPVPWS
jgi:hypothetical protein